MRNHKHIRISAALATFNEEENIIDCCQSLKKAADEIVVVDGSSTDRTRELARKLGVKIIKTTNKPMFHINKNLAIKNCTNDWVLLMDADERINDDLAREIKELVENNPKENGFWINRKNWFLGGFLKKGGAYPDSVIRLFRRGKGILPEVSVHEQVKIDGEVSHLKHDILHYGDGDFERYLKRSIRYTDLTADELKRKNPGRGAVQIIYHMIVKPTITFLDIYIRHKGYIDGFRGFIWAFFSAAHHFYAYTKYWHHQEKTNSR